MQKNLANEIKQGCFLLPWILVELSTMPYHSEDRTATLCQYNLVVSSSYCQGTATSFPEMSGIETSLVNEE